MSRARKFVVQGFFGLALGYTLSRMGFGDYAEIQKMFTFADLRLFLSFCTSLAVTAAGFAVLRVRRTRGIPVHPSAAIGGVLFGMGWAISGACPGSAVVQLGELRLWTVVNWGGIVAGMWIYQRVHERYFRWSPGSCAV